ncbi:MAG: hypothetical protein DME23_21890 [Verrucomicrobia bacterium]|nr:MAG: hypothetical protein DME23_21890 [Verrucomicrobiota bacterium]
MNPPHSPGASSPGPPHRHKGTSKPLAVPLGKVAVAIVDGDEIFRLFVQEILDQSREFRCVGSYSSGEVVLMDVKLPGMSGIECTRRLKALMPHLILVMVTGLHDLWAIDLARECGADGFLPKPFTAEELLATLSSSIPRLKLETAEPPPSGKGTSHPGLRGRSLTAREIQMLEYMAEGLLYKEIADRTGVSESAVHHMQSHIFKKLGATNKIEAIRKWKEAGRGSP